MNHTLKKSVSASDNETRYELIVWYNYTDNGKHYENYALVSSFLELYITECDLAVKELSNYPNGSSVVVYYNPDNPTDSVLNNDVQSDSFYFFLGSIACISVGSFIFWRILKATKLS